MSLEVQWGALSHREFGILEKGQGEKYIDSLHITISPLRFENLTTFWIFFFLFKQLQFEIVDYIPWESPPLVKTAMPLPA